MSKWYVVSSMLTLSPSLEKSLVQQKNISKKGISINLQVHQNPVGKSYCMNYSEPFSFCQTLRASQSLSELLAIQQSCLVCIQSNIDTLGIRLPIDFVIFYQIMQSTSGTESYSEGFTLIASILHKIVSNAV